MSFKLENYHFVSSKTRFGDRGAKNYYFIVTTYPVHKSQRGWRKIKVTETVIQLRHIPSELEICGTHIKDP